MASLTKYIHDFTLLFPTLFLQIRIMLKNDWWMRRQLSIACFFAYFDEKACKSTKDTLRELSPALDSYFLWVIILWITNLHESAIFDESFVCKVLTGKIKKPFTENCANISSLKNWLKPCNYVHTPPWSKCYNFWGT